MSSIKVSYHDDVRRFPVGTHSFEALLAVVAKSYKLASPDSLLLKYVDDENELITISSTEELQEAQRIANADGRKLLKVFLEVAGESKVKSPEPVAAPAPVLPEVLPEALKNSEVPFVLSKDAVAAISSIKTALQDVTVEAVPQEVDEAPEQKQEAETKQEAQPEAQPAQPEAQLDVEELVSLALAMLQQEWAKDEIAKACRLARDGIAAKLPVESVAAAILANCPNLACSRLVVTLIPLLPKAFAQAKTLNLPMSRVAKIVQFIPQLVQSCQPQYLAQILRNVVHGNFCNFENIEYDEVTIDVDQQQPQPQPPQEEEAQDETWVHHGITCDMCEVSPIVGIRYKCTQCHDFDMCSACEAKGTHDETHVMMKIRQPIRYHGCRGGQRLRAEFVADKTLTDHTVVVPGANLLKVWQIRNSGAKWPEGTKLVCIGGTVLPAQGAQYCAPVVAAQPGEVVDVAVDIVCPSQPGRAVGNFRLQAPSGARFGDRVWVSVDVADVAAEQEKQRAEEAERKAAAEAEAEAARLKEEADRKAAEAAKLKAEEELKAAEAAKLKEEADKKAAEAERILQEKLKGFKYSEQIVHLQQLGFKDIELNMYLLLNHKGDLQRVVEWLLNNVQPM